MGRKESNKQKMTDFKMFLFQIIISKVGYQLKVKKTSFHYAQYTKRKSMHRSRVGTGGPDPSWENHKAIGFLRNTGADPLYPASI